MIVQDITDLSQLTGPTGVIVDVLAPNAGTLSPAKTNSVRRVGTSNWGAVNAFTPVGSFQDLANGLGTPSVNKHDLAFLVYCDLLLGVTDTGGVRVTDGTDVAAQIALMDNGSDLIVTNTNPATANFVLAGAPATGDQIIASFYDNAALVGAAATYTAVAGDTLQKFIDGLVAAIATQRTNSGALSTGIGAATDQSGTTLVTTTNGAPASGATWTCQLEIKSAAVTCTNQNVLQTITAGQDIVYSGTLTQPGPPPSDTPENPAPWLLLTGAHTGSRANDAQIIVGAGSDSTTDKPSVRLSILFPGVNTPEVFDRIPAWKLVNGAPVYDGPTAQAQAMAAINGLPYGSSNQFQVQASKWFIASVPSHVNSPIGPIVYYTATPTDANGVLGTDGSTNVTTADLLGSAATTPGTGMYALSGQCSGSKVTLVGCDDVSTAGGLLQAFAKSQNAHACMAFADGTDTATAVTDKKLYGIDDYAITLFAGDWCQVTDTTNGGITRSLSPADLAAAQIALTPPQRSPMNLNIPIITGTSRTGAYANSPYDEGELKQLNDAGINVITMGGEGTGGDYPMIRLNCNSMNSDPVRGLIAYSTMTQFLAKSYDSDLLGQMLGADQSSQPGDKQRKKARGLFNGFLQDLQDDEIIDAFSVQCDLRNNDPQNSIARGFFRVDTTVRYRGIIDKIVIGLVGGQTVIAIQPQQVSPST